MTVKRGRAITSFGQLFGAISGGYIPVPPVESYGWLTINQLGKLGDDELSKLFVSQYDKQSENNIDKLNRAQTDKLSSVPRGR